MPNFRAAIGHGLFIHAKRANPVTLSGQDVGLTVGAGAFSYTPSHYVAPSAIVGAADDYTDLGASAWTAAANEGTPTTLGTAMARATSSNGIGGLAAKVRCVPGVYTGNITGGNFVPSFRPANSGSSGNQIVFFAQYPAATNWGNTSLYSELRRPGTPQAQTAGPVIGPSSNVNYVVFDGFYANEALCYPGPNTGIFQLSNNSIGTEYRRCGFTRGGDYTGALTGYNPNAIYLQATTNARVTDCRFEGRIGPYPSNLRQTANIEVYNSTDYVLEHNYHNGNWAGQHIKEQRTQISSHITRGIERYNLYSGLMRAMVHQQGDGPLQVYNNLVYGITDSGYAFEFTAGPARPPKLYDIHHNTFILDSGDISGFLMVNKELAVGNQLNNNIIYGKTGHTGRFINTAGTISSWNWSYWTINNNDYYSVGGNYTFSNLSGGAVSGLGNWQTECGGEAASITQDPLFVNISTNDYRLQGGSPAAGKGCYITGSEEIGVRTNPSY